MTVAVLLAAEGGATAGSPASPLPSQLRDAGVSEVYAPAGDDLPAQLRRVAALARSGSQPLLLCSADLVAHTAALLTVVTEPGGGSVALVGVAAGTAHARYATVREDRGLIAAAWRPAPVASALPGVSIDAGSIEAGSAVGPRGSHAHSPAPGDHGDNGGPRGTGTFLGLLRVGVADLPALAACAERLADAYPDAPEAPSAAPASGTERPAIGTERPAAAVGAVDLLLPELVAAGRRVAACRVRLLVADRAVDEGEAAAVRARMATVDEDAARLRLAVKERDDFFTTYFVNPISPRVTRWAARAGLSPTAVTGVSVALAVVAALGFALGSRPGLVAGALLLYVSFVLDCVDGQLARYSRQFSAFGGWLDTMADRSKEYLVYAGLAIGAERAGLGPVWPLAVAAIALQTVRHMTDTWYGALHDEAVARRPAGWEPPAQSREAGATRPATEAGTTRPGKNEPGATRPATEAGTIRPGTNEPGATRPATEPDGGRRTGLGSLLGRASERVQADTGSPAYWLKRIVVFPIGERWALIALTAAFGNGRITLLAVLGWGGLAAAYTLGLRALRARAMRVPVLNTVDTARHRDDGPLARALGAVGRGLPPLPLIALAALAAAALLGGALAARPAGWGAGAGPGEGWAGEGWAGGGGASGWVLATAVGIVLLAGLPAGGRHAGALDWLVPAALRAAEYLFVIGVAAAYGVPLPLLFALLFALALRHYDLTARMEKRAVAAPARPWDVGWDGRVALLAVGAAVGAAGASVALLTGYVVAMFAMGTWSAWAGTRRPPTLAEVPR